MRRAVVAGRKAGWCTDRVLLALVDGREAGVVRRAKCECGEDATGFACLRAGDGPQALSNHGFQT